ncbi:beta-lactamase family protein [Nonomuraea sp. NBC_01738]|uniref:serine hydrolase domain-containing protein n=1 Tax=Nonomuraea sp. NBC_01738 TaxID=2976003 RepID=UPI002E0FD79B|nr:beta-lactamase family protein [Nonomuraea sp. NBC_01738]
MLDTLEARLREVARAGGIPGASIAVSVGGELSEAATGVLNLDTRVEATTGSLFQVGSTTKVWTAALVMQLVEEGHVELDQPVRDHLPGFALADESAAAAVTVRHLLTHSGGFEGDLFTDTGRGDDSLARYVGLLRDARQIDAPGRSFSYCNSGFNVLGHLVATLRGGTWEQAMRDHLLTPLGVRQAALMPEEAILFRAAAGHTPSQETGNPSVVRPWNLPRSNGPAGASLFAAPGELVRFGQMILNGGLAADGTRVLSQESVTAMTGPQFPLPFFPGLGGHWGLGPAVLDWGAPIYWHNGSTLGQAASWWIVPGHDVVVAFTANGGDMAGLVSDLAEPLITELTGLTPPAPIRPPATPVRADLAPYPGRYVTPTMVVDVAESDGLLEITSTPAGLLATLSATPRTARFVPYGGHGFIAVDAVQGRHRFVSFTVEDGRATHVFEGRSAPRA